MEARNIPQEMCAWVYTLNTWTEEQKASARKFLEEGKYVHFRSTAIGQRAYITEIEGIQWAKQEYGDRLEVVEKLWWGDLYCHLKQNA